MTPHLTDEQLDHLLASAMDTDPHLATCAQCREQMANLRATFTGFRLSLTALAASLPSHPAPARTSARPRVWAFAAASLVLGVALLPSLRHPHPTPPAQPTTTNQDDEALLEGINQDLATPLAPSLKPLAIETQPHP